MRQKIVRAIGVALVMLILPFLAISQRLVSGTVISKLDQSAITGASIVVKGTKTGTTSGLDGRFSVKAKDGDVLVVTGIGIAMQEVTVGTSDNIIITVVADSKNLNEVVVTATGIKKESKKLGYSIQTIDASSLTKAREPDPVNALKVCERS